jgi:hypothetical protein
MTTEQIVDRMRRRFNGQLTEQEQEEIRERERERRKQELHNVIELTWRSLDPIFQRELRTRQVLQALDPEIDFLLESVLYDYDDDDSTAKELEQSVGVETAVALVRDYQDELLRKRIVAQSLARAMRLAYAVQQQDKKKASVA